MRKAHFPQEKARRVLFSRYISADWIYLSARDEHDAREFERENEMHFTSRLQKWFNFLSVCSFQEPELSELVFF